MRTRTCPSCNSRFKMCKKVNGIRTCRICSVQIHYRGNDTVLYDDFLCAGNLVGLLEKHISKRDGLDFAFDYADRARELSFAYNILDRARKYLARQVDVGLTPIEFCTEIVTAVLSDEFWSGVVKSIAMFMRHIGRFATDVFLEHKNELECKQRDTSLVAMVDFYSYQEEQCLPAAST